MMNKNTMIIWNPSTGEQKKVNWNTKKAEKVYDDLVIYGGWEVLVYPTGDLEY